MASPLKTNSIKALVYFPTSHYKVNTIVTLIKEEKGNRSREGLNYLPKVTQLIVVVEMWMKPR